MARLFANRIITSIDVGTTKICVLIAHQLDAQQVEIIGIGKSPSEGLHKGVVVDIGKTVYAIKAAIQEAELMANVSIDSAYVGISGGHIQSINSHGMVPIKRESVTMQDVTNVLTAARAVQIPEGQHILHVLPKYFVIDGGIKIHNPLGMHGVRLEVYAHIIMGATASVHDLITCCQTAGITVHDIVLEQLASAQAVLSPDERELGVMMIDIGGGTSDVAVYQRGSIRHTMVLPVAGNHFTQDLAIGLRTTNNEAERIKKEYGIVNDHVLAQNEAIEIIDVHAQSTHIVHMHDIYHILQPRAHELFRLIKREVDTQMLHSFITTGIVLTGGGSLLHGMIDIAEDIFKLPVRVGKPQIMLPFAESLDHPMYATGYGLLLRVLSKQQSVPISAGKGAFYTRIVERMKSWVLDFF